VTAACGRSHTQVGFSQFGIIFQGICPWLARLAALQLPEYGMQSGAEYHKVIVWNVLSPWRESLFTCWTQVCHSASRTYAKGLSNASYVASAKPRRPDAQYRTLYDIFARICIVTSWHCWLNTAVAFKSCVATDTCRLKHATQPGSTSNLHEVSEQTVFIDTRTLIRRHYTMAGAAQQQLLLGARARPELEGCPRDAVVVDTSTDRQTSPYDCISITMFQAVRCRLSVVAGEVGRADPAHRTAATHRNLPKRSARIQIPLLPSLERPPAAAFYTCQRHAFSKHKYAFILARKRTKRLAANLRLSRPRPRLKRQGKARHTLC
jgi:hypothetical protein